MSQKEISLLLSYFNIKKWKESAIKSLQETVNIGPVLEAHKDCDISTADLIIPSPFERTEETIQKAIKSYVSIVDFVFFSFNYIT